MNDTPLNGNTPPQPTAPQISRAQQLQMAATSAFGSQANLLIAFGVPVGDVINVLCEVAANLVAGIEPRELRDRIINDIRRNLPDVVARQYDARHTVASGLIVPKGAAR
jgi:hypothetical protein